MRSRIGKNQQIKRCSGIPDDLCTDFFKVIERFGIREEPPFGLVGRVRS
jgi:hypothetical protein